MPLIRHDKSRSHIKRSSLTGTIRSQQPYNLSLLHIKRNMTYYRTLAVFLHQIFCTKYHTVVIGHRILLFYFLL